VVPPTATAKGSEAVAVRPRGVAGREVQADALGRCPARRSRARCAGTPSPTGICHELDTMEALGRRPLPFSTARTALRQRLILVAATADDHQLVGARRQGIDRFGIHLRFVLVLRLAPHQATGHRTGALFASRESPGTGWAFGAGR